MIIEMVSQYQNFSSMASLFDGTLVSFSDSRIRAIKPVLFTNQSNLVSVNLPKCRIIGSYAFSNCGNLTSAIFPNCTSIGSQAFFNCVSLTSVNFPKCISIGDKAFMNCIRLESLYLSEISSVPSIGTSVFHSTPIGGYTGQTGRYGSIYVPTSLYNSFITATNWSSVSARMVRI